VGCTNSVVLRGAVVGWLGARVASALPSLEAACSYRSSTSPSAGRSNTQHDPCVRLFHCRHRLAPPAVRAVLRLDRDAQDRVRRLHAQPSFGMDDVAGAQPADGSRRPRPTAAVPAPRPRQKVQPLLRRDLPGRRHQAHPDRKCLDRLLIFVAGSQRQNPSIAVGHRSSAAGQTPRPARRLALRIRSRSMKIEFVRLTGPETGLFCCRARSPPETFPDPPRTRYDPSAGPRGAVFGAAASSFSTGCGSAADKGSFARPSRQRKRSRNVVDSDVLLLAASSCSVDGD
jgi:hypothetical protein